MKSLHTWWKMFIRRLRLDKSAVVLLVQDYIIVLESAVSLDDMTIVSYNNKHFWNQQAPRYFLKPRSCR